MYLKALVYYLPGSSKAVNSLVKITGNPTEIEPVSCRSLTVTQIHSSSPETPCVINPWRLAEKV